MSESKDGGPAFPSTYRDAVGTAYEHQVVLTGMSLRDYFAGQALVGTLAGRSVLWPCDAAAREAYELADAMLKARGQ